MLIILFLLFFFFIVSSILLSISFFSFKKKEIDNEKLSPYECGFNPLKYSRSPFSLRFFLVILVFLIFDIEIALLLPLGLLIIKWDYYLISLTSFFLIILMVIGLMHEWNQGSLDWL